MPAWRELVETARGFTIRLQGGDKLDVPAVLLATPPHVTQELARSFDLPLAHLCGRIRAASVVTVALGFARSAVGHPLDGAGVVVPRREKCTIRALSWVSSKWADRAPADRVLLRAYLGGINDPDAIEWSDEALIAAACRDTAALVDTIGDPELARVYRWRDSTPQLEVGHGDLMAAIESRLNLRPNLMISASGFRGTGIADCVADGRRQAQRAVEWIQRAAARCSRTARSRRRGRRRCLRAGDLLPRVGDERFHACDGGVVGIGLQQLLPRGGGAGVIVLAVGAHDADVEERLRVRGVNGERALVLRQRLVGPAGVPQARCRGRC